MAAHPKPRGGPLDTRRASPGRQGAAQHVLHVPIAAAGEGVHTPTELPRHLWTWDPSASLASQGLAKEGRGTGRDSRGSAEVSWAGLAQGCPQPRSPGSAPAVEFLGSDSLVAAVPTDGGTDGDRAGETPHAKPHLGSPGPELPLPQLHISRGPQPCPAPPTPVPVQPWLLAQPIGDPPMPSPITAWPHPGSAPAHWWCGPE